MVYEYMLPHVTREEFTTLKNREEDLVSSVMEGFNDSWKLKVKDIKATFRYNLQRDLVGIYIGEGKEQRLVVESRELNEAEKAVVISLYSTLEQRLDTLRISKERWVDVIPEL